VQARRTQRQVDAVCRLDNPVADPAWQVEELALEEIVLAYLARSHQPEPTLAVAR
jgi:ABC-2 type transport system ATP-binding protein